MSNHFKIQEIYFGIDDDGNQIVEKRAVIMRNVDEIFAEMDDMDAIIDSLPGQSPPFVVPLRGWANKRKLWLEEVAYGLLE